MVVGWLGGWVCMEMVQEAEREMWEQVERERHEERDKREKTEDELAKERERRIAAEAELSRANAEGKREREARQQRDKEWNFEKQGWESERELLVTNLMALKQCASEWEGWAGERDAMLKEMEALKADLHEVDKKREEEWEQERQAWAAVEEAMQKEIDMLTDLQKVGTRREEEWEQERQAWAAAKGAMQKEVDARVSDLKRESEEAQTALFLERAERRQLDALLFSAKAAACSAEQEKERAQALQRKLEEARAEVSLYMYTRPRTPIRVSREALMHGVDRQADPNARARA